MRRREFIAGIGSAAVSSAAWPLAARAQQPDRVRRIGILHSGTEAEPRNQDDLNAFKQELERLGWSERRNLRIASRFSSGRTDRVQPLAKELVAQQPDAIVAYTTPVVAALQRETSTIPIVFSAVSDPIGAGLIASLVRPGGNLTGTLLYEEGIVGKWLAMLKQVAPNLAHAALIANREETVFDYFLRSAEAVAPSLAIELVPTHVAGVADIEREIGAFARIPYGGFVLLPSSIVFVNHELIMELAARYQLPTVWWDAFLVAAGGLMSYGTPTTEVWRQSAYYIDRILRGAKPAELPVQTPTRYETALNLKTAKALGLTVSPVLLVAADKVIE
jgi:putative tryptophan/tyrosine transport system substrate-binding protein